MILASTLVFLVASSWTPSPVCDPIVPRDDVAIDMAILEHLGPLEVESAHQSAGRDRATRFHISLAPASLTRIQSFLKALEKAHVDIHVQEMSLTPAKKAKEGNPWRCSLEFRTATRAESAAVAAPAFTIIEKLESVVASFPDASIQSLHLNIDLGRRGKSHVTFQVTDFAESVRLTSRLRHELTDFALGTSFSKKTERGSLSVELRPATASRGEKTKKF